MKSSDLIELTTLLSGIIVSVIGAINQIRGRRAGDNALQARAGTQALAEAKSIQGLSYEPGYNPVEAELEAARRLLREHGLQPPAGPPTPPPSVPPPATG